MKPFEVRFTLEKETKNTYRYKEIAEGQQPPRINTLYIQKWATGSPPPKEITVSVKE